MTHPNILQLGQTALLVIDVQEAFRNPIPDFALVVSRISSIIRGAALLDVPVYVTEQYPKGLGTTVEEIQLAFASENLPIEKTTFSAGGEQLASALSEAGIKQVLICGLEAHVCVSQTAHELLEKGFQVHLLSDCVASRFDYNRLAAISKMIRSGVIESSVEMALFELMGDSKHPQFRQVQELIK